ncbi:MAG: thiamine phosphate synthase [Verrucomicrobiales bacterium]|nr:thiamine phosphate synthase [Verrucomicrobiales bacterium]
MDTGYLAGRDPEEVGRALCEGGADLLQLRAKGWPPEQVRPIAERLQSIAEAAGVWFVVNDHPELAAAVGAPLCHLGQEDFFGAGYSHVTQVPWGAAAGAEGAERVRWASEAAGVRESSRPEIGLSTHAPLQAQRAVAAGAAYVAVGPVYATPTKPGRPAVTLDYVRWAAAHLQAPWFAIGGITLENLDGVLGAGARRVCVVGAILGASDVAQACSAFKRHLLSVPI